LLIRRNIADGALAFFSTWCPKGTPAKKLIAVEGRRWAIEDSFETAKNELGLDHNESRSWHGWHRHVSLVMLAFVMMAAIRHHANAAPLKKTLPRLPKRRCSRFAAGQFRKSVVSRSSSRNSVSNLPMSSPGHSGDALTRLTRAALTSREKCNCNASLV
jgi:hypothetical protein